MVNNVADHDLLHPPGQRKRDFQDIALFERSRMNEDTLRNHRDRSAPNAQMDLLGVDLGSTREPNTNRDRLHTGGLKGCNMVIRAREFVI